MKQTTLQFPNERDIRLAMYQARERIEGPNWRDKTSEGHRRWHQKLTETFVSLAWEIGGTRPMDLAPEFRGYFIARCNRLRVMDFGPRIALS